MRLGVGLSVASIRQRTLSDRMIMLFGNGEEGAWYDPSDWSTMFQDSAGTTPVTALSDPVGKILDKSGNGNHATQSTAINRPTLAQDASGKYYLAFNGTNSRMLTSSIDFSGTNKLTLIAGVGKAVEGADGMIAELSAAADSNNGAFYVKASNSSGTNYRVLFRGSAISGAIPTAAAPDVSVVASTATLATPGAFLLRMDAVQHTNSTPSFGAVNFGNYALYLGARNNSTNHFNGRLYGLIVRGADSTTAQIETAEKYMNFKAASY